MLFLGLTGSGKSTMINYLLGHRFTFDEDSAEIQPVDRYRPLSAFADSSASSVTSYPATYPLNSVVSLCDCPGLGDTRSPETQVGISLCMDNVLNQITTTIRAAVVVIDYPSLVAIRGERFKKLIASLAEVIPDIHRAGSSLFFIYNRLSRGVTQAYIAKKLNEFLDSDEMNRSPKSKNVLQFMVDHLDQRLIVNICDEGETRQELFSKLRNSPVISGTYFNFNTAEEARRQFDQALLDSLNQFKTDADALKIIYETIVQSIKPSVRDLDAQLSNYKVAHRHLQTQPQKNELASLRIEETISALNKRQRETQEKLLDLELRLLEEELELHLIDHASPVEYRKLAVAWSKGNVLRGKDDYYSYNGMPFTRVDMTNLGRGATEVIKEYQRSSGRYLAKYRRSSDASSYHDPIVTVYVESRLLPENKKKIETLASITIPGTKREILSYQQAIDTSSKQIQDEEESLREAKKDIDAQYVRRVIDYEKLKNSAQQQRETILQKSQGVHQQFITLETSIEKLGTSMQACADLLQPLSGIISSCTFNDPAIKFLFSAFQRYNMTKQLNILKAELNEQKNSVLWIRNEIDNSTPASEHFSGSSTLYQSYTPPLPRPQGYSAGYKKIN